MHRSILCATSVLSLILAHPVLAQQSTDAIAPEAGGVTDVFQDVSEAARAAIAAKDAGQPVDAKTWMVAAANPLAVEAGARVLREGGTAADAMVAVQAVLGLVEPQSSGLGGGAFLVWYDAESGEMTTLDGRETAPLAATPRLFQDEAGEPLDFWDAVVGGRSVGVPGTPALMQAAHERWGSAEWSGLFDEAISLADEGFAVSARLAELVVEGEDRLRRFPATEAYFFPGGEALVAGDTLRNPQYAATLRRLATEGADAIYAGQIAQDIVTTVRGAEGNPGVLSAADLAIYRVLERPAVCVEYRAHDVCGMGPPSSGALTVGQILGMLGGYDLAAMGAESGDAWRLIGDASRLAFADRGRYMADSDFVPVPVEGLVAPGYLAERGALLAGDDALPEVTAGSPEYDHALMWGTDASIEFPSTSHISIVDSGRQRPVHDDYDRERVRIAADDERLPSEQRADRFQFPNPCRWLANREPGRTGQAPALFHGAHHRSEGWHARAGGGQSGRQPDHRLCGQDDHRPSGLGDGCAGRDCRAASGEPVRNL